MKLYRASTSLPTEGAVQRHLALFSLGRSRFNPDDVIDLENKAKLKVFREYAEDFGREFSSLRIYYRNRIAYVFYKGVRFMDIGLKLPNHRKVIGYYNDL